MSARTPETEKRYFEHLARTPDGVCPLCADDALETFTYWKIMKNDFPYDAIASVHHLLVPIRHVGEQELTQEERAELHSITYDVLPFEYGYLRENLGKTRTIPQHFHLHLLTD